MNEPFYLPMQFYYKTWDGQPYQRIARLEKIGAEFVAMIPEGEEEVRWGVAERLVARDTVDGTACFGAKQIAQYLRDMAADGFQFVEPFALVKSEWRCPDCGERRQDNLVWNEDDTITCQTCGCVYLP